MTRINGANWDAGRRLLSWSLAAGFTEVVPSASVWCFATPDERAWWGELWAERFTRSALADQLLAHRVADERRPRGVRRRLRRWATAPDGWFAVLHGEVLATA